jgi:hypothetical protein
MHPPLKLSPLLFNILKMLINDLPYFTLILWRQIESKCLLNIEIFPIKPILAFGISLLAVNMNGFIDLIGIEEKPPTHYQ